MGFCRVLLHVLAYLFCPSGPLEESTVFRPLMISLVYQVEQHGEDFVVQVYYGGTTLLAKYGENINCGEVR